jgi:hypothetical protein
MKVSVVRVVRRGKYHTRVETSDRRRLLLDSGPVAPYVGMELDLEAEDVSAVELRRLRSRDSFPGLIESLFWGVWW